MKKLLTLIIVLAIPAILSAQVMVPQVTKAFYNKATASWCSPCGSWGATSNTAIESGLSGKAVVMKLTRSSSGRLYNRVCSDLYAEYDTKGHSGVPNFYMNGVNETVYSSGGGIFSGQTETACINIANNFYSANSADVNAGFHMRATADSVVIDVTTTFFSDMNGLYYTAVYILEDGISYVQAGSPSNPTIGNHITRAVATPGSFGDLFPMGDPKAGSTDTKRYAFTNAGWDENNLHAVTVIWKAGAVSGYEFVNANDAMSPATALDFPVDYASFNVYPNPVQDVLRLSKQGNEIQSIKVFNILGEQMTSIAADLSVQEVNLDVSSLQDGVYIIQLVDSENRQASTRFVKK